MKELGRGDNGTVYEIIKEKLYALKELNHINNDSFRKLIKEYEILNILHHPNVIKTYGIHLSDETTPPSIILEHCPQNIENVIKAKLLSKSQIVFSIYQIAEGMKYVHFRNVIHRDLKPSNIVIAKDGTIKISDFGISKIVDPDSCIIPKTTGIGTLFFMAPEIVREEENYNEKVDVYSFGVLIYFILSGGEMPKIKIHEICNGKKAQIPSEFTQLARDLINSCWNFDPNQRPSFNEICALLEENHYHLIDINDADMRDALDLIDQHKRHIPFYLH